MMKLKSVNLEIHDSLIGFWANFRSYTEIRQDTQLYLRIFCKRLSELYRYNMTNTQNYNINLTLNAERKASFLPSAGGCFMYALGVWQPEQLQ